MGEVTTITDVIQSFHTHPMAKKALPEGLENEFFMSALAQYELEIKDLDYNTSESKFNSQLNGSVIYTLGMLMYLEYLTRELSRAEKLNGFYGKDIHLTGSDSSKNVTYKDLVFEKERVQELLHKQKTHAYN